MLDDTETVNHFLWDREKKNLKMQESCASKNNIYTDMKQKLDHEPVFPTSRD